LSESCGKYDYELSAFYDTEEHEVFAIAAPMEEAEREACPMLVASQEDSKKTISVWNDKKYGLPEFDDRFIMGVSKLSDVMTAFGKVKKVNEMSVELGLNVGPEFNSHLSQKKWNSDAHVHDVDEAALTSSARLDECGQVEYDVSLYVDNHMYVVATPRDAKCPVLASHAVFGDESTSKQMLVWNTKEQVAVFDTALPVGTYALNDYVGAYKTANPGNGVYEIVENNCGDFVANMGVALGVKPTEEMSTYIVDNLIGNSRNNFVSSIRESGNYNNIDGRKLRETKLSDKEVVQALVQSRM